MRIKKLLSLVMLLLCSQTVHASFLMQDLKGNRVDLLQYVGNGQWSLVLLWTTDCAPCEAQKPMIEDFHKAHRDGVARVIGVALDGPAQQRAIDALIAKHQPSYPNLVAYDDVFHKQFLTETGRSFSVTPTYLLYRPDGELYGVHTGPISRAALEQVVRQ